MSAFTDQTRNVLNRYARHPMLVREVEVEELLAEALRRCDPGDTDINALVKVLRRDAAIASSTGQSLLGSRLNLAANLLERAFGEPT